MAELKTFVFTDICRSVDLKNEMAGRSVTERDMAFIESILTPHRERIEARLEPYNGRIVSTAGDGHFLVFQNTIFAAQWAVEVQREHRDRPIETPDGGCVEVRISIHVGVPQVDPSAPDNFVGKSVDYASRLNDFASGEQILVSRSVMAILDDVGLEGISFHDHGRHSLKGIGRVEIHELIYDESSPRDLRQRPSSPADREWTVVPTIGFEETYQQGSVDAETSLMTPTLSQVGNYRLEEVLGSGGMGDVYKGRHTQFDRVRAIKVIKPQFVANGNQEVVRRFYREIKAVGALQHKNIVVAIDSSAPTDRLHYLVMEYIDGVALNDLVDQLGQLSVADACEIVRQAARGLQYIYRHDMVHRDIKPSNLMLTEVAIDELPGDSTELPEVDGACGVVKILDLGLALLSEDQHDRVTRYDNKAMGTGMYMSPEQWKTTSVDIRADIYSLGCTLYHLLAGNPPFADSDLRPEKAHEKSRVPPIHASAPIPRKLWDVLCKMLAKNREERYATPAEVSAALMPFAEGHDLLALIRGYAEPEGSRSALRHTRSDSGARIDTWFSRASHMMPTRRWLLLRGVPLVLIGAAISTVLWMMEQNHEKIILDAEQQAQDNLPHFAKLAVTKHIGKEITKRFEILQRAAKSQEMISLVERFDPALGAEKLSEGDLQKWINLRDFRNHSRSPADSWYINDLRGIQIARSPIRTDDGQIVRSFLKSYAHRNYFHGLGKDLSKEEAEGTKPIEQPNISAVYKSSNSGKLKVAFSVPIWNTPADGAKRSVVGVLSMSVDLGEFKVLDRDIRKGKEFVLIDLRSDYVELSDVTSGESIERRGMILHHPLQSLWRDEDRPPRVDTSMLAEMGKPDSGVSGFISGYSDPLSIDRQNQQWGAFEPVRYTIDDPSADTKRTMLSGWVVLVQQEAIK